MLRAVLLTMYPVAIANEMQGFFAALRMTNEMGSTSTGERL